MRVFRERWFGPRILRGGVLWIPLNFSGPPQVTFHQQALSKTPERHRRCKEQRFARHDFFRLTDVGQDLLGRHVSTTGQACQRQ